MTFKMVFRTGDFSRAQNPEEFDGRAFDALVRSFEEAVPSRRNASLIAELRTWARDPKNGRWSHAANCSLLRWVTTTGWKTAVPHAEAIWTYLFGKPVPTWYVWRQSVKKYEFHPRAWAAWYESLGTSMKAVEAIYKQHNDPSARGWPAEKQCQCRECQAYRNAHPLASSL